MLSRIRLSPLRRVAETTTSSQPRRVRCADGTRCAAASTALCRARPSPTPSPATPCQARTQETTRDQTARGRNNHDTNPGDGVTARQHGGARWRWIPALYNIEAQYITQRAPRPSPAPCSSTTIETTISIDARSIQVEQGRRGQPDQSVGITATTPTRTNTVERAPPPSPQARPATHQTGRQDRANPSVTHQLRRQQGRAGASSTGFGATSFRPTQQP